MSPISTLITRLTSGDRCGMPLTRTALVDEDCLWQSTDYALCANVDNDPDGCLWCPAHDQFAIVGESGPHFPLAQRLGCGCPVALPGDHVINPDLICVSRGSGWTARYPALRFNKPHSVWDIEPEWHQKPGNLCCLFNEPNQFERTERSGDGRIAITFKTTNDWLWADLMIVDHIFLWVHEHKYRPMTPTKAIVDVGFMSAIIFAHGGGELRCGNLANVLSALMWQLFGHRIGTWDNNGFVAPSTEVQARQPVIGSQELLKLLNLGTPNTIIGGYHALPPWWRRRFIEEAFHCIAQELETRHKPSKGFGRAHVWVNYETAWMTEGDQAPRPSIRQSCLQWISEWYRVSNRTFDIPASSRLDISKN